MALPAQPRGAPRGRASRTLILGVVTAILLAACGGAAAGGDGGGGGGGGGGGAAYDTVISQVTTDFGTSMVSATVEGDTLKITLIDNASAAMARLFMCSNVVPHLKDAGLAGAKALIVSRSGAQLSTQADCKS
jgi:hypothetical protein